MKSETIESIKILTACFTINFLYGGATRLASVFFVESIYRYEVNRKQASFPYVLAYMMRTLSGPLQGYLQQIFGMESLVIFANILGTISIAACFFAEDILAVTILWGVVFGFCFGLGTQYLPAMLNLHFTTNRSKANGFAYAGAGFGGIMMPPIIDACIKYYGLNGSFLVLAGIVAHLIPFSLLLKSPQEKTKFGICNRNEKEKHTERRDQKIVLPLLNPADADEKLPNNSIHPNDSETETNILTSIELDQKITTEACDLAKAITLKSSENIKKKPPSIFTLKSFKIFIDPSFIIMLLMTGGNTLVLTTMWTIILDFVRDKGVEVNLEIYYVMIIPLADIFGRIGSGFVIDKKFLPTTVFTSICCVCTGLTLLGLLFTHHYLLLMIIEFLFPIFYGFILILQIALIHEFIQPDKRTMAMVCRSMLYSPLSLTTSPMIGYFRGERGSYDGVIYILTGISFFCGFIILFVPHLAKRRRTTTSDNIT